MTPQPSDLQAELHRLEGQANLVREKGVVLTRAEEQLARRERKLELDLDAASRPDVMSGGKQPEDIAVELGQVRGGLAALAERKRALQNTLHDLENKRLALAHDLAHLAA